MITCGGRYIWEQHSISLHSSSRWPKLPTVTQCGGFWMCWCLHQIWLFLGRRIKNCFWLCRPAFLLLLGSFCRLCLQVKSQSWNLLWSFWFQNSCSTTDLPPALSGTLANCAKNTLSLRCHWPGIFSGEAAHGIGARHWGLRLGGPRDFFLPHSGSQAHFSQEVPRLRGVPGPYIPSQLLQRRSQY